MNSNSYMVPHKFEVTGKFYFPIDMMVNSTLKFPKTADEVAKETADEQAERILKGFVHLLKEELVIHNGYGFDFNIRKVNMN